MGREIGSSLSRISADYHISQGWLVNYSIQVMCLSGGGNDAGNPMHFTKMLIRLL
jgi:hypothetical protein